jgi:hypothetical protein
MTTKLATAPGLPLPLQSRTLDSTAELVFVVAFFVAFLASLLLALFVSFRVLRGYRRSGERRLLLFGVGVLCIVFLSKVTNVALASTLGPDFQYVESIATSWRIVGGLLILYAIYQGADRS